MTRRGIIPPERQAEVLRVCAGSSPRCRRSCARQGQSCAAAGDYPALRRPSCHAERQIPTPDKVATSSTSGIEASTLSSQSATFLQVVIRQRFDELGHLLLGGGRQPPGGSQRPCRARRRTRAPAPRHRRRRGSTRRGTEVETQQHLLPPRDAARGRSWPRPDRGDPRPRGRRDHQVGLRLADGTAGVVPVEFGAFLGQGRYRSCPL